MKQTQTLTEYQERLVSDAAKDLARQIDESVLMDVLVEGGWTRVQLSLYNPDKAIEILNWCEKTLTKNQWKHLAGAFVFRKKKEAEWFILRWK